MKDTVKAWCDNIIAIFDRPPETPTVLMTTGPNARVLDFLASIPVSNEWVGETDEEVNDLKNQSRDRFFDSRGPYLYYRNGDGAWVMKHYMGDEPYCRPGTLVVSGYNQRMYCLSSNLVMNQVNMSTEPAPR